MRRNFWNAAWMSSAVYAAAVLLGFVVDFRVTGFAVLAILLPWTLFCTVRALYLRHRGAHKADALPFERESYGFALGGSVSSLASLIAIVVLTQVV
jgi:hypothetical protein